MFPLEVQRRAMSSCLYRDGAIECSGIVEAAKKIKKEDNNKTNPLQNEILKKIIRPQILLV